MARRDRLNAVVAAVVESGGLEVPELARRFGVSEATIRRDLQLLEQERLLARTHGAATVHAGFNDLPLSHKTAQNVLEKRRIAERALELLAGARVVGLTGGTTVTEFARAVRGRGGVSVVTNALNVASILVEANAFRVLVAGGEVRNSSHETVGPTADQFLSDYHTDVAFLGVDGVDAEAGCTNYDPSGARANAVMQRRTGMTVVLADASKIGRVALAPLCAMSAVDVLVTDRRAPEAVLRRIRERGCRVLTA